MGTKTIRGGSLTFDESKEKDIIDHLEGLAGSRDLGAYISNLIRADFDGMEAKKNSTSTLSLLRQQFFKEVAERIKAQDRKIDEIYAMCSDLYGLARLNKVMGLDSKAENMLSSQFVLQRQQNELKQRLGVDNLSTTYLSEKLLNEKDKADKVLAFSLEVYEAMLTEVKSSLFKPVEVIAQTPVVAMPVKAKQVEAQVDATEEFIELVEKPATKKEAKDNGKIEVTEKPAEHKDIKVGDFTGDRAALALKMLI